MKLWRDLTSAEIANFRLWARANYKLGEPISGAWHPIVQTECVAMNAEAEFNPITLEIVGGK